MEELLSIEPERLVNLESNKFTVIARMEQLVPLVGLFGLCLIRVEVHVPVNSAIKHIVET